MIRGCRAAIALAFLHAVPVSADEFTEFRIPPHQVLSWNGTFGSALDRFQGGSRFGAQLDNAANGQASTQFLWLSDSDLSQLLLSLQGSALAFRNHNRSDYVRIDPAASFRTVDVSRTTNANEGLQLSLEQRKYPWRAPLGWQVRLDGSGRFGQLWQSNSSEYHLSDSALVRASLQDLRTVQWDYQYAASAEARLGWGRVRDATGVLDARVFEERLRRSGVLRRPLSAGARQRLASLAYVQYAFAATNERPAKFVWQAIEQILKDDGAIDTGGVDPGSVLRAGEPYLGGGRGAALLPLAASPVGRTAGTFVGMVVTGRTRNEITRNDSQRLARFTENDSLVAEFSDDFVAHHRSGQDEVLAGARAEYHRPLGLRWQLDASEQLLVPLKKHRDGLESTADLRLVAIVADRWMAEGRANHQRRVDRQGGAGATLAADSWQVSYGVDATYFLEDRLRLQCGAAEQQSSFHSADGSSSGRSLHLSIGITYRLAGRRYAPGLFTPGGGALGD